MEIVAITHAEGRLILVIFLKNNFSVIVDIFLVFFKKKRINRNIETVNPINVDMARMSVRIFVRLSIIYSSSTLSIRAFMYPIANAVGILFATPYFSSL